MFEVRAGPHQRFQRVRVRLAAIAEHDGLHQGGPAEIVDVVERRAGRDQDAHHLGVAEMRGRDQRRALVRAGDRLGVGAAGERELQHRDVVGHGRDGDDVVFLRVERIRIGAALEQRLRGRLVAEMRRDMQRRAAVRILRVRALPGRDQPLDLGGIAFRGRGMQAGVDPQLGLAGRDLRRGGQEGQQCAGEGEGDPHKEKVPAGEAGTVYGVTEVGEWASLPGW